MKSFFDRSRFIYLALIMIGSLISCSGHGQNIDKRARALENLGNTYMLDGKLRDALENFLEAEKDNPQSPELNHKIALAYRELRNFDLSLQYFKKAMTLQPQFPDAQNNMGTVYLLMGDYDTALTCFEKVVNDILYRTPHFAYNNMGLAYHAKGEIKKAITYYQKAIQQFTTFSIGYKNLGMAYESDGALKDAVNAYENVIKLSNIDAPEHVEACFFLGRLFLRMGKKEQAKEMLQRAIDINPRAWFVEEAQRLLESIKP